MRIAHLLSNRKWTERAEPAADLAASQQRAGHEVLFVCGRWTKTGERDSAVVEQAKLKGLATVAIHMDKHFSLRNTREDVWSLRDLFAQHKIDVVHAHMDNAHLLAALALRKTAPRPLLIKSAYEADELPRGLRLRYLYARATDGLIVLNARAKQDAVTSLGFQEDRVAVIPPGVDLARFDPGRMLDEPREDFRIPENAFVVGMVTRIRRDRRVDLAVEAVALLAPDAPALRFLIVGHGEDEEQIRALAKARGIEDRMIWPGYCRGDRLVAAYRAMHALLYPVPGTDPSCRTVREAMAAGVPVIASQIGFLRDLIVDGRNGYFSALESSDLASAIRRTMANHGPLAEGALAHAKKNFSLETQARDTVVFYERILRRHAGAE